MATTADHLSDPELLATEWDLSPRVDGQESAGVERLLDEARGLSHDFAGLYVGRLADLDAAGLQTAMTALAQIYELVGRAGSYASLRFSPDTADPPRGALLQHVQERATEIETELVFFELEWASLDDQHVERLLADERLDFCRPHLLSEPEEKLLAEKSISSQSAWERLFGEQVAGLRVALGEEELTLDVALSRL